MKKAFFKYFISIFSITVVTLLLQSVILVVQYSHSQTKWKTGVYNDFVDALEESIESGRFKDFGLGSLRLIMSSLDDNRVSGYVVRDTNGSTMFTFGKTSEGRMLAAILPVDQKTSAAAASDGKLMSTDSRNTVRLNVVFSEDSLESVEGSDAFVLSSDADSFMVVERKSPYSKYQTYLVLPTAINADDIVGSITLAFEGEDLFIIDLLTYSPRTYAYSKDVFDSCLRGVLVSVPVCLVIALIAAWIISSRNIKFIDGVRTALKKLARGESDVKMKRSRNSELDEISTAIEDLDKELQKNAMSRRAWLSSISHDLNTPASAIKMMVDGMGDGVFPLDETSVAELRKESDTLNERIGKVIDFSSMQADSTPVIDEVPVAVLENCIVNSLPFLKDGSRHIVFEPVSDNVRCDVVLMTRACMELIKNAFEYGEDNGPVVLRAGEDSRGCFVCVENNGSIPKDIEDGSFLEPWIRGDWSRTSGGSGLGLPIVCTVARLHGGAVTLENVEGGTVRATIRW